MPSTPNHKAPLVGMVLVNWNLKDTLRETLASCFQIDYPNFKVVVVDNGSHDGSQAMVQKEFPQVHLIANPVGLGYAKATSQGMEWLASQGAQYLFSTSNDVTFDPPILREMVAAMEADAQIGIIGSKVYFFDRPEVIWHAGAHIGWHGHSFHYGWERRDHPRYDRVRECDFVTGCGYLVRAEIAKALGFLKEDLVFYSEDSDFCYRVRARGFKIIYLPAAKLWHKTSTTLGKNRGLQLRYSTRNNLYLLHHHKVGPCYPMVLAIHLLAVLPMKMLFFMLLLKGKNVRGIWQGIMDWRKGSYGMIKE
jgi:GT2 family glycosyltransferase